MKKLLAILVACLMPICLIAGSGDVNGDGNVNAADIVELLNHLNGKPTKNFNASEADVNNDGVVDKNDVAALSYTILSAKVKEVQDDNASYLSCPDSNHPHLIDLGLPSGTQWRCCNEGASTPEDYGGYYEFGQVASAPSVDQIKELMNHTTSEWTTQNGVNGRKFTGSNGGTIFLPAAGCPWDGAFDFVGSDGYYWSSTPGVEGSARGVRFGSSGCWFWYDGDRSFGLSVRPVRPVRYVGSDEPVCPDSNHPHWIDLGLPSGTQWRCCNEGASTPEGYGGYYEFGQVASAPSWDQIEELIDHTTSVWTTQNGVTGRKFTGSNGGTIFLPAAGYRWDGEFYCVRSLGGYWSSTPNDEYCAGSLDFRRSGDAGWGYYDRVYGRSVRPVR